MSKGSGTTTIAVRPTSMLHIAIRLTTTMQQASKVRNTPEQRNHAVLSPASSVSRVTTSPLRQRP